MIALFTIWGKKLKLSPDFKPQKWYYIIVIVAVVISITGLSCFAVGLTGGASSKVVGWYGGNMYDVGEFGDRLAMNLTRDGKVYRYIGNPWNEEGSTAVTYHYYLQDGVGTYEYANGKLTIHAAPEWKLSTWEKPVTVYTDCNGIGSFLKYEGYVGAAYSWYHTNNKDI